MSLDHLDISVIEDHTDIAPFFAWLDNVLSNGKQPVAIDTETGSITGLWVPRQDKRGFCRLWQIGTADSGWAIAAQDYHGVVSEAMDMIVRADNPVIFANMGYDQHVFLKEGWPVVPWHRVHDVVIMHRLARPWQQQHGLKPACVQAFGAWAGAGQSELKRLMNEGGYTWEDVPVYADEYTVYGVVDCCLTVMLYEHLKADYFWWMDVEHEYRRIMFNSEERGALIDMEALSSAEEHWEQEVKDLLTELKLLGVPRPSSNKAVIDAFEAMGFEPQEFSARTGDPTYNKMVLNSLQDRGGVAGEAAKHLILYRRASKWLSVYGRALRNNIHADDTVNFTVNTMQARTGRSSISKPGPPLQTIPKHWRPRSCFRARKGYSLWAVDYSSQEIRIQASLSGDQAMINFFDQDDDDYHQYVADLAGIPRAHAKISNYARAYGAGVDKLAQSAGTSTEQMKSVLSAIDSAFPRAMKWKDEVTKEAEERAESDGYPWVALPYGRVAGLEEGKEFTTAANTIIQGHGSDVLKLAACRISQAGLDHHILLPVHDELLLEIPEGDSTTAHEIAELMEDTTLTVPLTTDVTGPLRSWGEAYLPKEET